MNNEERLAIWCNDDNEERLAILAGARAIGFDYADDGKLTCTLDQLVEFSACIAAATAEQIRAAFEGTRK